MRPFVVCIHDATPAYARETRVIIRDLAPLLGRRLSFGVVPNWYGEWPLAAHPDYCRLVQESSEQLLLHGYIHRRRRGWGPTTLLAEGCDEMNGLDAEETRRTLERGQRVFTEAFGEPARGFLAPGWQPGRVSAGNGDVPGLVSHNCDSSHNSRAGHPAWRRCSSVKYTRYSPSSRLATQAPRSGTHAIDRGYGTLEHVLGFFSLESRAGPSVRLATWTWDCGRWGWLGLVGHGIGRLLQSLDRGVPTLAIHPRDLERGFWPKILRLTRELLETGYEPSTPAALLAASDVEVDA